MTYQPTWESIKQHQVPDWYHAAKLGIMITWGLYSVPAFASSEVGDIIESIINHGSVAHMKYNPYAEWYLNTMRLAGSPTREYHDS